MCHRDFKCPLQTLVFHLVFINCVRVGHVYTFAFLFIDGIPILIRVFNCDGMNLYLRKIHASVVNVEFIAHLHVAPTKWKKSISKLFYCVN